MAARKALEELLVDIHDIFARHRFDIGIKDDTKVKLTPTDESPAYSQNLPTPTNLKKNLTNGLTVEMALLHKYGIVITLPFSRNASPVFAQRNSNGKLRLLVDLRKFNNLLLNDYINNKQPVSALTDAAQHIAGKIIFSKFECSQAYHFFQMADRKSVEMFSFDSRTFAYRRLAQGLNRWVSASSGFARG